MDICLGKADGDGVPKGEDGSLHTGGYEFK
jgi:hypothetical protein